MTEHTTSYYAASANKYEPFPTLEGSINCDVCVVGGGYTGLSSALHLAEMGYDVVVLEGARIGFGASGRNGGQLVNSYSRDIDVIEKNYGPEAAKMLGSMMFEGGDIIRERIQRYQIQCDYRPGGLFVAMNHKQLETLEEQKANWERYGNTQLELLDREAIRREVDSDRYVGALLDHSGRNGLRRGLERENFHKPSTPVMVMTRQPSCCAPRRKSMRTVEPSKASSARSLHSTAHTPPRAR